MQFGIVGLGRMGLNMARRLRRAGLPLAAWNRSFDKAQALAAEDGALACRTLEELVLALRPPRLCWLMLPAGPAVDEHMARLLPLLQPGDILVDGGNSWYKDDLRHAETCAAAGVQYVDAGVSGGIWGLTEGYCTMVGGPAGAVAALAPYLDALAPPEGWMHCGGTGSGHYVKMIHNGIEYGMMQAYAEGLGLLQASGYGKDIDMAALCHLWNQGSVVRSWLLELAERAFAANPALEDLTGHVEDSGEGRWTVQESIELAQPAPVLALSLMQRFRSRQDNTFQDRVLAALRREFGGHAVKEK